MYGGLYEGNTKLQFLRLAVEKTLSESLRNDHLDVNMRYMKSLLKASRDLKLQDKYIEAELTRLHSDTASHLGSIFNSLLENEYILIAGPAPWSVKIQNTVIELKISGIFRDKSVQTLHLIDFTPYSKPIDLANDPAVPLKITTMSQFVKPYWNNRPQAVLHLFGLSTTDKLIYRQHSSNDISEKQLFRIKNLVQLIEQNICYPTLPCTRECQYKQQCLSENL